MQLTLSKNQTTSSHFETGYPFLNAVEEDYFEERAAIMQYDGGLSQSEAEEESFKLLLQRRQQYNLSA